MNKLLNHSVSKIRREAKVYMVVIIEEIKMKASVALLIFIMLIFTNPARAEKSREDFCNLMAEMAETAMTLRQFGRPLEDLMLSSKLNNAQKRVARIAYQDPVQEDVASKDRVIREFKADQKSQCRKQLGLE